MVDTVCIPENPGFHKNHALKRKEIAPKTKICIVTHDASEDKLLAWFCHA
jgi:heme-degrading monooxygenase HmoA